MTRPAGISSSVANQIGSLGLENGCKLGWPASNGEEVAEAENGGELEVSYLDKDAAQIALDIQESAD